MGFPLDQCRLALGVVGNDMQRAADWLLEGGEGGGDEEGRTSEAGPSTSATAASTSAAAASAAASAASSVSASAAVEGGSSPVGGERWRRAVLRVGGRLEASDEGGTWCEAAVVDTDEFGARIHFMGWGRLF